MKNTIKFFMALTLMVIVGGGNVWATSYKNIHVALKASPIGVGKVYFTYEDDSPTKVKETDDEVDFKLTLGEDGNEADNSSDLNGFYPLQLCATPKEGYRVRGFVTELKETYTDDDFLKGTYKDGVGDDDKHGKNNKYLLDAETGTVKVFVNVNINQTTDGTNNQSEVRGRNNWNENPDFTFYAIFEEGETKPIIKTYAYADGQEPMPRQFGGSFGVIEQTPEYAHEGDYVTLKATPNFDCEFVKWVDESNNVYSTQEVSFTAKATSLYKAFFRMKDYTMNSTGIRSYSSQKAFRIADDDELGAYCVKEIADGQVKLDGPFKIVPDCRGAILMGTPDATFTFQPLNSETDESTIFIFQSGEGASFNSDERIKGTAEGPVTADGTQYALGKRNDVVGFYKVKSGATIPQGKAYIVVTESAKDFIGFADDDVTNSIAAQIAERMSDEAVYNLQGQRVADDYRGLVIKNGKKFINQ